MKKKLNTRFVLIVALAVAVFGVGAHVLHAVQISRNATEFLKRANRAEQVGKLTRALDYLARYLKLHPNDTDALAKQGLILKELAETPRQLWRAFEILDRVLRRDPSRHDIRWQAIRIAIDIERFNDARDHLDILTKDFPNDCEWNFLSARCEEGDQKWQEAKKLYSKAKALADQGDPSFQRMPIEDRVDVYVRLAGLLRLRLNAEREASDAVMADLIQNLADAFQAHLARFRYHFAVNDFEEAQKDLEAAKKLAPNEVDVILADARLALWAADLAREKNEETSIQSHVDHARQSLKRGLEIHPESVPLIRALASLEKQAGQPEEALAVLEQAVKLIPDDASLQLDLAETLIQLERYDAARKTIRDMRHMGAPAALLAFLEARIPLQQRNWHEAARRLERVVPLLATWSELQKQANLALGRCYQQLGEPDLQLKAYQRVLAVDPLSVPATLGYGDALVTMGQIDSAAAAYRRIAASVPAMKIELARLLLWQYLRQPAGQRNPAEIRQLLQEASQQFPNSSLVVVLQAELLAATATLGQARELLEQATQKNPQALDLWSSLATVTARQDGLASGLTILNEAQRKLGDSVELRLARARLLMRYPSEDLRDRLLDLTKNTDAFDQPQRRQLLRGVGQAILGTGDLDAAKEIWARIAKDQPYDVGARLMLFDLAVLSNDLPAIEKAVAELERVQGEDGTLARYARASQLILAARKNKASAKGKLERAKTLLIEVGARRHWWARVPLRLADIAELEGDTAAALVHYQRAIKLGERTPSVIARTVQLLSERQRYAEVEAILSKFRGEEAVMGTLRRFEVESSIRRNDTQRAIELARKAVPPDSTNFRDHLWYGQVMWLTGQLPDAEKAFRKAAELAKDQPLPWVRLLQFYVITKQPEQAKDAFAEAKKRLSEKDSPVALARCYELIGDKAGTLRLYQAALAANPDDPGILRSVVSYYLRNGEADKAVPHLRKLIELQNPGRETWARKILAIVLAASGDYQKTNEALDLLGGSENVVGAAQSDTDSLRLRAILLAGQRGRQPRLEAIKILEQLASQKKLIASDQFLLAQLYERSGDWKRYRELMLALLADTQPSDPQYPQYVATFADSLLRRNRVDEAGVWIDRLDQWDQASPKRFSTVALKARLLKARSRGGEAVQLLAAHVNAQPKDTLRTAVLLEQIGEIQAAEKHYRRYVSQADKPTASLVLALFLGRNGRIEEGLQLCLSASETCSGEAVSDTLVNLLYTSKPLPQARQIEQAARQMDQLVQQHPKSAVVLQRFAAIRNLQGRYGEVMDLYRRVLKLNDRDSVAMNNLAWFLAVYSRKTTEAMELINRAIDLEGPLPALLETRAAVHLEAGQTDLAIRDLEEAAAESRSDSIYFHLAQAYWAAGNRAAARRAFQTAESLGLNLGTVHALEHDLYSQLKQQLSPR